MTLLVDTHAYLWYVSRDPRLSRVARRAIEEAEGDWSVSVASVWEMAIKSALGRLTLPAPVSVYIGDKIRDGLRVLAIEWSHAAEVERLPFHHRDPFDRLIIAQAISEHSAVVTRDRVFSRYGVDVIW